MNVSPVKADIFPGNIPGRRCRKGYLRGVNEGPRELDQHTMAAPEEAENFIHWEAGYGFRWEGE